MKKLFKLILPLLLFLNINTVKALEVVDVKQGHFAAVAIINSLSKGYMKLAGENTFLPEEFISRAEFVDGLLKVIQGANIDPKEDTAFSDVNNETNLKDSIFKSEQLKLIKGYPDYTFKPTNNILRVEANAVIANITKGFYGDMGVLDNFSDKQDIPKWAIYPYVKNVVNGLYVNYPDVRVLRPMDYLTRAEAAYLYMVIEKQYNLIDDKYKKTEKKKITELVAKNTLNLVNNTEVNVVEVYNTKINIMAGNVILANPQQKLETQNLNVGDEVLFSAPNDVYSVEGTFLYPAGTVFSALVEKEQLSYFRKKKHRTKLVFKRFTMPNGISNAMAGVFYVTDMRNVVTTKTWNKHRPVKEGFYSFARSLKNGEKLRHYSDKLTPMVKYDFETDDTMFILLTGDMVIPNEYYYYFELPDRT